MLLLHVCAPFATFRTFAAGAFRPSAPFLTPSAAYGLVLHIAGIESRQEAGKAMTVTARGLPTVGLALGAIRLPTAQTLYQQLHDYPVGSTGKDRADETRGNKYNIRPVRREFLADLDAYIGVGGNDWLEARVREGLRQGARFAPEGRPRYGLPFLGDNNFLISRLAEELNPKPAYWYRAIAREEAAGASDVCQLSVWIDREDMTRTRTRLYSRATEPTVVVPADAWTQILPPG
jgi:CRISPR-associated protein Cas5t